MEHLFIYGTLAPGKPNEHILKNIKGQWKNATVKGNLEEKGWGSKMGCPGIYLDENGKNVNGLIFASNELNNIWEELDNFEGEEYIRSLTQATLENGENINTYIYALK